METALVIVGLIFAGLGYWASRAVEEPTYCDGCKKFSRGTFCPHC